ncbi:putative integral membrane protein [Actinacidiphila reveromycinica]|uniref:Putative integral membrane protein n=1 Tax=Actinacidiphila reveromycinica TaxID=659352 RepID=A0A7U3VQI4_9ACTN|nr:putative integral membrane protein [Streptomyces sp. SN-593]
MSTGTTPSTPNTPPSPAPGPRPTVPARITAGVGSPGRAAISAPHLRTDRWWLPPLVSALGLAAFIGYSTWRAFANAHYYAAPYVSPFYSPCLASNCTDMNGGADWHLFGNWWGLSPALLVLVFPLGFRLTCYYYRKTYYRSFWLSPPACAVAEPHASYSGETRLPLVLQNVHRYFFYLAVVVAGILSYDTVLAFRDRHGHWGHAGLGTLVLLVNIALIWAYTLSCHSCRHIIGGKLRHFSAHPVRYRLWGWVGVLNGRHMLLAWSSLISVGVADLYVYLVSSGAFDDPRFF